MLQKDAISEISLDTPGLYSNVFLVRKVSGGWCPIIGLKQLNHHIDAPHFRMHTVSSVLSSVERGDYVFKIDIGNPVSRRLVNILSRPSSVITPPVSVISHTEHSGPQVKRSEIRTRTSSEYPFSGASVTLGSGESFPPNIKAREIDDSTHVLNILPENFVIHRSVPIHGITQ